MAAKSFLSSWSLILSHLSMSKAIEEVHAALKRSFQGSLLRPDDAEYPEARRIWNGLVARKPGLIARCKDSSDVQAAVRAAAQAGACFRSRQTRT
jgi:hypothetical protein